MSSLPCWSVSSEQWQYFVKVTNKWNLFCFFFSHRRCRLSAGRFCHRWCGILLPQVRTFFSLHFFRYCKKYDTPGSQREKNGLVTPLLSSQAVQFLSSLLLSNSVASLFLSRRRLKSSVAGPLVEVKVLPFFALFDEQIASFFLSSPLLSSGVANCSLLSSGEARKWCNLV